MTGKLDEQTYILRLQMVRLAADKLCSWIDDRYLIGDAPVTVTLYRQDLRDLKEALKNLK